MRVDVSRLKGPQLPNLGDFSVLSPTHSPPGRLYPHVSHLASSPALLSPV